MTTTAIESYINELNRAKKAIKRISQYLEDNGEVDPEKVHWADTGSMTDIASTLSKIKDFIDNTGEYEEAE